MLILLLACVARDYVPYGPVSPPAAPRAEAPRYTGPAPEGQPPIPPLRAFGVRYDLDLVVVTTHPGWSMHELAYLDGLGWMAKDADASLRQSISAEGEGVAALFPEVPLPRFDTPLRVDDRSDSEGFNLSFDYQDPLGEQVHIEARGAWPEGPAAKRNTSTMGHSADAVAAALDIWARSPKLTVEVSYDGQPAKLDTLLGVPIVAMLGQTQAGFAACDLSYGVLRDADGVGLIETTPGSGGRPWPVEGERRLRWEEPWLIDRDAQRTLAYRFVDGGLAELVITQVREAPHPMLGDAPVLRLALSAPLPDMRRPFTGEVTRQFTLSLDDQPPHGHGLITATSGPEGGALSILPAAPRWLASRPMRVAFTPTADGAALRCAMLPPP